jgi:hypothetical protein
MRDQAPLEGRRHRGFAWDWGNVMGGSGRKRSSHRTSGRGEGVVHVLAAVIVCLVSGTATAEIFRCIVDGRVTYSDRPCGSAAAKVQIESAAVPPKAAEELTLQQEANLGHVVVGMTPQQVEQVWGRPAEIANEKDATGATDRWTYNRSGESTVVTFQAGKVAKIAKTHSLAPPPRPAADQAPDVTISELEDREREQKAGERKWVRQGMTQEEVRGKLGPPWYRRVQSTLYTGPAECWTYPPALRDPQTRTILCFSLDDTRLMTIDRTIER